MIKFIDSILSGDPAEYLVTKADEFWNILNPKKKNNSYHYNSLVKRINRLLLDYNNDKYLELIAGGCTVTNARHIGYLTHLCDNNHRKLKEIIKASPDNFPRIIGEAFDHLYITDLTVRNNGSIKSASFGKLLTEKVFFYDSFRKSDKCVNFYKSLNIEEKQCFYCNDSTMSLISKESPTRANGYTDSNGKMLFDLDHFYLKSTYPFLALSLYNLIPCCGICNSRFRSTKPFNIKSHINPYLNSFDNHYEFMFDDTEIAGSLNDGSSALSSIKIGLKQTSPRSFDKTALDLEIEMRYQQKLQHVNNIFDTLIKYHSYPISELEDFIYGVNEQHIPKNRHDILKISKAKFSLDFLDQVRHLLYD